MDQSFLTELISKSTANLVLAFLIAYSSLILAFGGALGRLIARVGRILKMESDVNALWTRHRYDDLRLKRIERLLNLPSEEGPKLELIEEEKKHA